MMGKHQPQKDLFSYSVDLDKRVRQNHPLRKVAGKIDFSFVREEVKDCYGHNGNEGLDPEIIMKLMFLLFWDNVRSERELMQVLPERLDYLWFLGYSLDDDIPDHSVLSKARARWGQEVFESLFIRTVHQCVKSGLVGSERLHMDGSLIDADASRDSIMKGPSVLMDQLRDSYQVVEAKLEAAAGTPKGKQPVNRTLMSKTDPDAPCAKNKNLDLARPRYKAHRAVDDKHGVITGTRTTPGDVTENTQMQTLVEQHLYHTGIQPDCVVGDKQYGTVANFRQMQRMGITTHMAEYAKGKTRKLPVYGNERFSYDTATDTYICPAGKSLYPRRYDKPRNAMEYKARKHDCLECPLRGQCTTAVNGRTLLRHDGQDLIDQGVTQSKTPAAYLSRRRRKWRVEGSFGQATRHHFKRSRYRRLWRQRIQDWIICAVQNIKILIQHPITPDKANKAISSQHLDNQVFIDLQMVLESVVNKILNPTGVLRWQCRFFRKTSN